MIQLFDQSLVRQRIDCANSPMEDSRRKFYAKFTEFRNRYLTIQLLLYCMITIVPVTIVLYDTVTIVLYDADGHGVCRGLQNLAKKIMPIYIWNLWNFKIISSVSNSYNASASQKLE